jgi:hypothetical protein
VRTRPGEPAGPAAKAELNCPLEDWLQTVLIDRLHRNAIGLRTSLWTQARELLRGEGERWLCRL